MTIWPQRATEELAEGYSGDPDFSNSVGWLKPHNMKIADTSPSDVRASKTPLAFDLHLRRILVMLYAVAILVTLLVANIPLIQQPSTEPSALNWLVLTGGLLLVGASLLPWRRLARNLLLVPILISVSLLELSVYFSGGWSSHLSIFYLFMVVFCALYFAPKLAAPYIGLVLLVSLSPQLYAPDEAHLIEHLVIYTPAYLALAVVSYYIRGFALREHKANLQKVREVVDRFHKEALVDPLTGISNRTYFEARLREEYKRNQRLATGFVVVFLDLDDFKQINDAHGHRVGDEALVLVARILRANVRQIDTVARYGGDEFVALLPGASMTGVRNLFARIQAEIAEQSSLTLGFVAKLSAGMARYPGGIDDLLSPLEAADEAMYQAKRQGKDRIFTIPPEPVNHEQRETSLEK